MNKTVGTVLFLGFAVSVWLAGPVLAIALNVLLRPDYVMR